MASDTLSSRVFPVEIASLPNWCRYGDNKVPFVPVNQVENALTYKAVHRFSDIGFILSNADDVIGIDIDLPAPNGEPRQATKEEKQAEIRRARKAGFTSANWNTPEYLTWLRENYTVLQQLEGTPLEPLLRSTYVEFSPSGLGLHMWALMPDKPRYASANATSCNTALHGQLDIERCFLTCTGVAYPGCSPTLAEISPDFAPCCFDLSRANRRTEKEKKDSTSEPDALAEFLMLVESGSVTPAQVQAALDAVPSAPERKKVKYWEKLTGKAYIQYDFWLAIGMALHDYGTKTGTLTNIFITFLEWSKKDTVNFTSESEVSNHWHSFGEQEGGITIATLLAMSSHLKFEYPRRVYDKKADALSINPLVNEFINFEYLMKFYNIELWSDDLFYLSGDEEIMHKYFARCGKPVLSKFYGPYTQKELDAFTLVLCQDSNWRGVKDVTTHIKTWIATSLKPLDMFDWWVSTPYAELPEELTDIYTMQGVFKAEDFDHNSTVEYIFNCLNTQYHNEEEKHLYFTLLKKTLMQMIKFREADVLRLPFVDNGGMLILTGQQNAYKSTFCKQLLPRQLEDLRKEINAKKIDGDKAVRDFIRYFATRTIVQLDDFDDSIDLSSSFFKNILSGNDMSFVDIYATQEQKRPRKAVVIGTTNKERMVLSTDGTRRLWFIPVGQADTDAMLRINLHKLYNDLRTEFKREFAKGNMPWLLTSTEIQMLEGLNKGHSAMNDLDIIMEELWPTNGETMPPTYLDDVNIAKDKSAKTLTSSQIRATLSLNGHGNSKVAALEHAIKRHCTKWTGLLPGQHWEDKNRVIKDGRASQNWREDQQRYTYNRWILPPRAETEE